jgi:uncharacterized protein YodC (DUF2158 family)
MADTFKVGQTVKLKSGGPLMTIDSINGEEATCEWFDSKQQIQVRTFGLHVLMEDDDGPVMA